jgi:serine phosphatase RsbU (regulator of sigma subunit)
MTGERAIDTPLQMIGGRVRRRQTSPEARAALRRLRRIGVAALVMIAGGWLPGIWSHLVGAPAGAVVIVELVRMHRPHILVPRGWTIGLALAGALLLVPGLTDVGRVAFSAAIVVFLVLRRHRVLRLFSSGQRAVIFAACVVALGLVVAVPDLRDAHGWFGEILHHVHGSARLTLVVAAAVTAVHLFLGIRLHFLRLRPKLAVAGFLIAAVPVVLLAALALVVVYGVVGSSTSTHAQSVLGSWLDRVATGELHGPGPFEEGFGEVGIAEEIESPAPPPWRDELSDAIEHAGFDPVPDGLWVRHEGEIWAVRTGLDDEGRRVLLGGRRLGPKSIQRLADQLGCEVDLMGAVEDSDVRVMIGGRETGGIPIGEGEGRLRARPGSLDPADEPTSWTEQWRVFGGATIDVHDLEAGTLESTSALISLRTRVVDLVGLITSDANVVNQVVGVALLVIAVLFLMLEALALYFGLRIVGGITLAVGGLHRAMRRLAAGDLDTRVDLPNQDEFGDLAEGFNDMTRAIRVAQDQIVEKQRLEQEIETARRIQMRLLPESLPDVEGYQLAGGSTPSKQVGGDYFDFIPLPDGRLGVAVADVSGKGIPAALLMSNLQASLQGQVLHEAPVTEVVERMNDLLARSTDAHMFATFFYGVLEPETGRVVGVNAGHEPPLVVRADGTLETLPPGGLILGMLPGQGYAECRATLEPGDSLILYTDGITEAMGPGTRIPGLDLAALPAPGGAGHESSDDDEDDDEIVTNFFGEDRLREIAVARRHESAASIRRAILDAVSRHVRDVPQSDDVTLVVIKREAA